MVFSFQSAAPVLIHVVRLVVLQVLLASMGTVWAMTVAPALPAPRFSGLDTQGVWWVNPSAEQQPMSAAAHWCLDASEQLDAQAVSQGVCPLQKAKPGDLTPGLKAGALWLRLQLGNASATELKRWLVVGHPQLQQVTLWVPETAADGSRRWQVQRAGNATPQNQRAVPVAYPVLPVVLPPQAVQTVYVRVASANVLDATTVLWQSAPYVAQQGRVSLLHVVAMGGMLLAALLGLLLWGLFRERIYLLFGLGMAGEVLLEACRSGMMAVFFWPTDQPFWLGLTSMGGAIGTTFFALFILEFIGPPTRHRWLERLMLLALACYVGGTLWAAFVDFRSGLRFYVVALQAVMLLVVALLVLRIRQGQRQVWYLLLAFSPTLLLETLRFVATQGGFHFGATHVLAAPWGLMLLTPLLLLGMVLRSRDLHDNLVRTQLQSQARVDFLTQMSHELRAPLNTVMGYAQLLQNPGPNLGVTDASAAIHRGGQRLLGMIDEILDYARGQADRLQLDLAPLRWQTLMVDLQVHGSELARQHGHRFDLHASGPPVAADLLVDERRLRQVLDNLLVNASLYGAGSPVSLTCSAQNLPGERLRLRFEVADSGPGISPAEQAKVFAPFVRGQAQRQGGGRGVGLGLAIARQLTTLMGGTLTLHSEVGAGCRFVVQLECQTAVAVPEPAPLGTAGPIAEPQHTPHLLVVDDEGDARQVLSLMLQAHGLSVQQAASGHTAMALLKPGLDMVLTDQFMDDGDGWALLAAVRQQLPGVPVLMLSSAAPQRPAQADQALQFDGVLLKPVDQATLMAMVSRLLARPWPMLQELPDAPAPPVSAAAGMAELAEPDAENRQALLLLVQAGAVTDILAWAKALAHRQPELAPYAAQVRTAALAMDFARLHRLASTAAS